MNKQKKKQKKTDTINRVRKYVFNKMFDFLIYKFYPFICYFSWVTQFLWDSHWRVLHTLYKRCEFLTVECLRPLTQTKVFPHRLTRRASFWVRTLPGSPCSIFAPHTVFSASSNTIRMTHSRDHCQVEWLLTWPVGTSTIFWSLQICVCTLQFHSLICRLPVGGFM